MKEATQMAIEFRRQPVESSMVAPTFSACSSAVWCSRCTP